MDNIIDLEAYRAERARRDDAPEPPLDFSKRLLAPWRVVAMPVRPRAGMQLRVRYGRHPALGENHTVSRVNGRSFYVSHGGRRTRRSLFAWRRWLEARMREGWLLLDGWEVRRPPNLDGPPGEAVEPIPLAPRSTPAATVQPEQAPKKTPNPDTTTPPRRS